MNDLVKNIILWVVIGIVLLSVFQSFGINRPGQMELKYSVFLDEVKDGRITDVVFEDKKIWATRGDEKTPYLVVNPETDNTPLINTLQDHDVQYSARLPEQQSLLMQLFVQAFPILILVAVWVYFMRQMQGAGGGRGAMSFGKSRARLLGEDQVNITFADVAGVEEAKEEVVEIVDFLKDPSKFQRLGGKIPKGVLMVGSPGTGKTLLARAIAGEAKVPFFTISGSDFVEMFVGVRR